MFLTVPQAIACLNSGGVVIFPTETLYGIAASVRHPDAVARIVNIKGRDPHKPMPLIAANMAQVHAATHIPSVALPLIQTFWPGPLTVILPAKSHLHPDVVAYDGTVGVRISSHPVAHALAEGCDNFIIATSANVSGQPAVAHCDDLDPALIALTDGVINAGQLHGGLPSTVIECQHNQLRVIREGAISKEALERAAGRAIRID